MSAVAEGRLASIAGAVLLGGASSRMGADKASLALGGVSFAGRISAHLTDLFEEVYLVGGEPPGDAVGMPVADGAGPRCPLRGLIAVLETATAERVLLLATDIPLVIPELLLALCALPESDVVLPRTQHGPQPLCAIYRKQAVLPLAKKHLAEGKLALRALLDTLSTTYLEPEELSQIDPEGRSLTNVNTPEERAALDATLPS